MLDDLFGATGADHPHTHAPAKRPRNTHIFARDPHGHCVEPQWCSQRLFAVEAFGPPGAVVFDPACGWGRIPMAAAAAGYYAVASDLVDLRGGEPGPESFHWLGTRDFVRESLEGEIAISDNIVLKTGELRPYATVCNPPYGLLREFCERALAVATYKVALLVPLRRLPAAHWLARLPLETTWLLTPRPSIPTGEYIADGGKVGGGGQDFCWLVFNNLATVTAPRMRWLHRDGGRS